MGWAPDRQAAWCLTALAVVLPGAELIALGGRRPPFAASVAGLVFVACVNGMSALLARQIAREHESRTAMRRAWLLIAAGALTNGSRTAFELVWQLMGHTDSSVNLVLGLRQIPIAGSLLLMAAGLAAMWSSFTSLGLGLKLRRRDWLLMTAIVVLIPPVLWSRAALADAHSPLAWVQSLQFASPFLLAVTASMSVVLYRISREMGQGLMAIALRCLAASFVMRLVALVILTTTPFVAGAAVIVQQMLLFGAHGVFLAGLVYRRELSSTSADLLERYRLRQSGQAAFLP